MSSSIDPLTQVPTPDCATVHIYSYGNVHYYQTVYCPDPTITGYGITVGAAPIPANGCVDGSCSEGSTVTPAILLFKQLFQLFSSGSDAQAQALLAGENAAAMGKPSTKGEKKKDHQIKLPQNNRAKKKKFGKKLAKLEDRDDVDDIRKGIAAYLRENIDDLYNGIVSRKPQERYLAQKRLETTTRILNSAQQVTFNTATTPQPVGAIYAKDIDYSADLAPNLVDEDTQITANNLLNIDLNPAPENAGITDVDADDAAVQNSHYVQFEDDDVIFRLADITLEKEDGSEEKHHIGHQVLEEDLPSGTTPLSGGNNVIFVDKHAHVHRIRVRTGNGNFENNSREYLVYSTESLADQDLP